MMVEPRVELQSVSWGKLRAQSVSHTSMNLETIAFHRHWPPRVIGLLVADFALGRYLNGRVFVEFSVTLLGG